MRKDYHLHPTVVLDECKIDTFIEQALGKNIYEICITDHMPLSISNSKDRIPHGLVKNYCERVRECAEKYADRIKIKCGIEIDYHPSVEDEIEAVLEAGSFDYILASSHMHVFCKDFTRYTANDFAAMAIENYVRAIEKGWFSALSHFDMYRFVFEKPERFPLADHAYDLSVHENNIKAVLRMLSEKGMFLEINPHLAETKGDMLYTYPDERIVSWACEKNVRFSYGSDAHKAGSVGAMLDELETHPVYKKALFEWENSNENNKRT